VGRGGKTPFQSVCRRRFARKGKGGSERDVWREKKGNCTKKQNEGGEVLTGRWDIEGKWAGRKRMKGSAGNGGSTE